MRLLAGDAVTALESCDSSELTGEDVLALTVLRMDVLGERLAEMIETPLGATWRAERAAACADKARELELMRM